MTRPHTEKDIVRLVNDVLNDFFVQSTDEAAHIDSSYQTLWQHLHELIMAGGKRLRPQMLVFAYEAFGGSDTQQTIPIAAAQELLHFCLLIHDDIIDRDYMRYGVTNVAGQYKKRYAKHVDTHDEQTHYAHSAAILGGDLMLSGAHQLVASSNLLPKQKTQAHHQLTRATFEVAGGELLDTELGFMPHKAGLSLKVARYKTASYSFISPLTTGAELAGISADKVKVLREFASTLGIAYQLVDDLLGVFGDENVTGKSTSSDIIEGKKTYMFEQAFAQLSARDKNHFMQIYGNPKANPEDLALIKQLFESSGARQATQDKINELTTSAHSALAALSLTPTHYTRFEKLVNTVTKRRF